MPLFIPDSRLHKRLLILFCLLFILIVPFITVPSYNRVITMIRKNNEINRIYENWLIVKSETIKYMLSSPENRRTDTLVRSVSDFEIVMDNVLDKELFSAAGIINNQAQDEIATVVLVWQQIQLKLVETVLYKNNFDIFVSEIYNFSNETDFFEKKLKNILVYIESHLVERTRYYWTVFIIIVSIMVLIFSFLVNLILNYHIIIKRERRIRDLSGLLMKIRDEERLRMSLDLHDIVVQNALVINKKCEQAAGREEVNWHRIINDINTVSQRIIKSAREISYNLRPQELDKPLKESLENFCTDFSFSNNIRTDLKCIGLDKTSIDDEFETAAFKMIHECLFNVVRHSRATEVAVSVILAFPEFIIRVEDNGIGFEPDDKLEDRFNLGLRGLADRVNLLEGKVRINSSPGSGTSVVIRLPCRGRVKETA